ncbi:unnamed protein product [Sphenostylis stenocarpa]|uniref:C2H2-type domain-containing protein n=1 Tax=Sphenostylis stenocarpa TaxID=92480 RepID=A0AA86TGL9_9FABA|nr:unnamed protein product [Sphenostylis stenocarpa]
MTNHLYNDVLNYAQFPEPYNNTGPKGCKLCSQVFTTTQALLNHLESHMAQEEVAIRRLYSSSQHVNSQKQLGSSQFPPQLTVGDGRIFQPQPQPGIMQMPQPFIRNPFFNVSQIGSSSLPARKMQVPPPKVFPCDVSTNDDGSKAYILKLEKPIKKIDFIDLVNVDDDNNSNVEEVDLDLKL